MPHNFIHKVIFPKNLIQQYLDIMPHMPVDVDIDRPFFAEEFTHQHQTRIDHFEITHRPVFPCIGVGELLDDGRFLIEIDVWEGDFGAIVRFAIEWWIDVDQIDFSPHTLQSARGITRQ